MHVDRAGSTLWVFVLRICVSQEIIVQSGSTKASLQDRHPEFPGPQLFWILLRLLVVVSSIAGTSSGGGGGIELFQHCAHCCAQRGPFLLQLLQVPVKIVRPGVNLSKSLKTVVLKGIPHPYTTCFCTSPPLARRLGMWMSSEILQVGMPFRSMLQVILALFSRSQA